jgi:hypothetical protein
VSHGWRILYVATPVESLTVNDELIAADLILLLLAAPTQIADAQNRINGITRLEKLMFLAVREQGLNDFVDDDYVFEPYHYGPYSKKVYEEVDVLEQAGLLVDEHSYGGESLDEMEAVYAVQDQREGVERRFHLTPNGQKVAALLAADRADVVQKLSTIKDAYAGMPLPRLVRYVYKSYPETTERSIIRDKVLGRPTRD